MRLEDFINNNRNEFDNEEPLQGHEQRFAALLAEQDQPKKVRRLWIPLALAACISGLLVGFGFIFFQKNDTGNSCHFTGEIAEVNAFYRSQLNKEVVNLKEILEKADDKTQKDIMQDVEQLQNESQSLVRDLCGKDNEKAIAVLVKHYQTNIEAVQQISNMLANNI